MTKMDLRESPDAVDDRAKRRSGRSGFDLAGVSLLLVVTGLIGCGPITPKTPFLSAQTEDMAPGISANLIGLSIVSEDVWWAGGSESTILRTTDGGGSWDVFSVGAADSLQFRDVHAVSADTAFVLSIGPGDKSRIYRTIDGGASWVLQWKNEDPDEFFDCFDFWSPTAGLTIGDASDGRIAIMKTMDGAHWRRIPDASIPAARGKEGGFAASGTCLVAEADSLAWIATGAAEGSRIYRTANRGRDWTVQDVDFISGVEAAGLMTLAFKSATRGFAAGGALTLPDDSRENLLETVDGGLTWIRSSGPQLPNVYGLAVTKDGESVALIAVGPKGMDVSFDGGLTWNSVDKRNYWSVQFVGHGTAVAVGPRGRVTRVNFLRDHR